MKGEAVGIFSDTLKDIRNRRGDFSPILTVAGGSRINLFLTQDIALR